jgi:hypothetical protein
VDELEKLARAFGLEPWELLRPQGQASPSPLGLMLGAHLDRMACDEKTHTAAYAAAVAVIDALSQSASAGAGPDPSAGTAPQQRPAPAKRPT